MRFRYMLKYLSLFSGIGAFESALTNSKQSGLREQEKID